MFKSVTPGFAVNSGTMEPYCVVLSLKFGLMSDSKDLILIILLITFTYDWHEIWKKCNLMYFPICFKLMYSFSFIYSSFKV